MLVPILLLAVAQANDALVPVPRTDMWWKKRHYAVVDRVRQGKVGLIFVGDSITHAFGGEPQTGEDFNNRGGASWDHFYKGRNAVNMGFSGDRTQHVLWRLENGEVDRIDPKVAVVMIGTNNMGSNTPEQTADGVEAVCTKIHEKLPDTKILLLAIFPRDKGASQLRGKVDATNALLKPWAKRHDVTWLDIRGAFIDSNQDIPTTIMPDGLHPNEDGYARWAKAMEPTLAKLLDERPIH